MLTAKKDKTFSKRLAEIRKVAAFIWLLILNSLPLSVSNMK
jgi:hypothetical protein